jgi:carbonic anhydrase/acetyltransferase-like protein (isoleucine patch superfamily)
VIAAIGGKTPTIAPGVYIAPGAVVVGEVAIGARASIWFNTVLRGDMASITVGEETSVQDLTMVHIDYGTPTVIGNRVVVGHRAIIHGATVGDECIIGMGAILLNRSKVGRNCIVAAGAVLREGFEVPDGMLVAGVPAEIKRPIKPEEIERIRRNAADYVKRCELYLRERPGE